MQAATHSGTCQICGSLQKLPRGVLAKHGYTTKWGFFSGVCTGSDYKPFEESKGLIDAAIDDALGRMRLVEAAIRDLERTPTQPKAWKEVYVQKAHPRARGGWSPGYVWVLGTIETEHVTGQSGYEYDRFWLVVEGPHAGRYKIETHGHHEDAIELARKLNVVRAERVERVTLKQLTEYVTWQRGRIAAWKPHPEQLVPVPASAGPLVHWRVKDWGKACAASRRAADTGRVTDQPAQVTCSRCKLSHSFTRAIAAQPSL